MGFGGEQYGDLLLLSVGFCVVILTLGIILVFRDVIRTALDWLSSVARSSGRRSARAALEHFSAEVTILGDQVEMLDHYSTEYHHAFFEAGWAEIINTYNELVAARQVIQVMMDGRRYREAFTFTVFLLDELPEDLASDAAAQYEEFAHLPGWQARMRESLYDVIESVQKVATVNEQAGIKRSTGRKPTLMTLAEIRKALSE